MTEIRDGLVLPSGAVLRVGRAEAAAEPEPFAPAHDLEPAAGEVSVPDTRTGVGVVTETVTRTDSEPAPPADTAPATVTSTLRAATAEGRLVQDGWTPPTEALRTAAAGRETLRSAVDGLRTRGRADTAPITAAIRAGDRDGVITAIVSHAVGQWLDAECQRPATDLTGWSHAAEQALIDAVYGAPGAVLASLAGFEGRDAAYLRSLAEEAAGGDLSVVDIQGRAAARRPMTPSLNATMLPRL